MPIPIAAGNWKMNTTIQEARNLASQMKSGLAQLRGLTKILCPPFVSLASVQEVVQGSDIQLGAQNVYFEEKGAFTGEISPSMLAGLCRYVIIGHSERRHILGEGDALANKKVKAALKTGLIPILCVGELLAQREEGRAQEVVSDQLRRGLDGVDFIGELVIAYEPVWAIGTGIAATPEIAQEMMGHVRDLLGGLYGRGRAGEVPLLYGGSVNPDNIGSFVQKPDVNGALVGGASLKALDFVDIARQIAAGSG